MASKGEGDVEAIEELQKLQKQLGKKQTFEAAVSSIAAHLRDRYASASPPLRRSIYSAVCRVATILQTRYTAPGFWQAGLRLFEEAGRLVAEPSERNHLRSCVVRAREHLHEAEYPPDVSNSAPDTRFLFEGHLTVGPEPPPPAWLVAQNFLTTLAATQNLDVEAEPSVIERDNNNSRESNSRIDVPAAIQELINNMQEIGGAQDLESVIEASLREVGAGPQRPPPASKEVVAKLPIVIVTEEVLGRLGSEMECAVCRENLVINDKMQELPCKHLFHPDCLKPWLDEHNSCPTCRHELQTDDHAYESWKEREKEAEEERKGAANALRGGEYMYV
ncbi:E3 ubiquitin-protein ligase AIP2 [Acorus gramineus]|uniref:RING-type E3 ubiquitin transferase n=1 Tax=Acorus gramineus TaxID=55184 RepID=A0AAV9AGU0_ACOGR|nr:E3 ubiquitin-protein ligase AIP2 [Acorus gramineus]